MHFFRFRPLLLLASWLALAFLPAIVAQEPPQPTPGVDAGPNDAERLGELFFESLREQMEPLVIAPADESVPGAEPEPAGHRLWPWGPRTSSVTEPAPEHTSVPLELPNSQPAEVERESAAPDQGRPRGC